MTVSSAWMYGLFGLWANAQTTAGTALLISGYLLTALLGYLMGSLNFGLLISKHIFHQDIRNYGSGNAGMTNMLRTYGKGAALATLLGDALKAAFSVLVIGHFLLGDIGAYIAGLACIVGHAFPVFFGFRGGKGVVTTATMILCLDPPVFLILFIVFVILVAFTKYISMGSIICMMMYPLVEYKIIGGNIRVLIAMASGLFVIFLHRSNIKRLLSGTENKFSLKKKKDSAETKTK